MDADAVNDAFDAMSDARRRAVTMVASGGAVLAPEDFDRNETDATTTTTTTTTATATPAAHRGRMTGETEEDYASMRRALDALRERSKETTTTTTTTRDASASAARVGGATRATRATIATAYEMVETFASRGAVTTAKFSKVGEHCLATGDRLGAVSVRRRASENVEEASATVERAHEGEVVGLDWSLNGGRLSTAGKMGVLKTWNVTHTSKSTVQLTKQSEVNAGTELTCVAFHVAQDDIVFVGTTNRELLVVDVQVGVVLDKFPMLWTPLCLESNTSGNVLFVGDEHGSINVLQCEVRVKKTLTMRSDADFSAAAENPLQRVIDQRSASETERMNCVVHANAEEAAAASQSLGTKFKSKFNSMMSKAKKAMPRMAQIKAGYRLRLVKTIFDSPSPVQRLRYCPFIKDMNGPALVSFQESGEVIIRRANSLPYSDLHVFTGGKVRDWEVQNGMVSFTYGQSFHAPLLSASNHTKSAIYLLPMIPGAPVQVMQLTDDINASSEGARDVATVSTWSHDSTELIIAYASGKVVLWRQKRRQ